MCGSQYYGIAGFYKGQKMTGFLASGSRMLYSMDLSTGNMDI